MMRAENRRAQAMSTIGHLPEATHTVRQKRGKARAVFEFRPDRLHYSFDDGEGTGFSRRIRWAAMPARVDHEGFTAGDPPTGWVLVTLPLLALVATFRDSPQPLTFLLYVGATLAMLAAVLFTRRWRVKSHTLLPTPEGPVAVLGDERRDALLAAIDERRAQALRDQAEGGPDETVRERLRRLRWLVEMGAAPAETFETERLRLIPGARPAPPPPADRDMRQRALGTRIDVAFRPDHLVLDRRDLFDGRRTLTLRYRRLGPPSLDLAADPNYRLHFAAFGWVVVAAASWLSFLSQRHPQGHYVGGEGLKNAIVDFGPVFLVLAIACVLIERGARRRYVCPYPGVEVLKDARCDAILAELESRRIAAMRRMAEPDPLIDDEGRRDLLDALVEAGDLGEADRAAALAAGEAAAADPTLDEPADGVARSPRRVLH
jgi:hypothetical protein